MRYLLPIVGLLAPATLDAQTCLRGQPAPACRTFFITEGFAGFTTHGEDILLGGEFGVMRNRGATSAWGVGLAASNVGVSLRPRYRHWVRPDVALDVGPGLQWVPGRVERFEANGQLLYRDRIGVWLGAVLDVGSPGTIELAAGLKTAGEPGLLTWGAGLVASVIYFIWYSNAVS